MLSSVVVRRQIFGTHGRNSQQHKREGRALEEQVYSCFGQPINRVVEE